MQKIKKKIFIIISLIFLSNFLFYENNLKSSSADSQLNILDYYNEGIPADYTEYFVLWNQGQYDYPLQINATAMEFVGATGWPELQIEIWEWADFRNQEDPLRQNLTQFDYYVQSLFTCEAQERYILAITNLDPVDEITYNLTLWTQASIDFVYTEKYNLHAGDMQQSETTTVTYFGEADPTLFAMEEDNNFRVLIEVPYAPSRSSVAYEHYFFIENTGTDSMVFLGFRGFGNNLETTPQITGYIQDWENYNEGETSDLIFFTIVNDSTGIWFNCLAGHRYSLWVQGGTEFYPIDLYIIVESFGDTPLYFEDGSNDPPSDVIEIIYSLEDPWITSRNIRRWIIFGGSGGAFLGLAVIGWWIKRRL